jgi:uncharacterized damage-inducible protein DinB
VSQDPTMTMLFAGLDSARDVLRRAVGAVQPERRGARPAPERWSVSEILEHLNLVERAVTHMLTRAIEDPSASASDGGAEPLNQARVLDRTRRLETIDRARPVRGLDWRQAWNELTETRRELLHLVSATDAATLRRVRAPHFVFGTLDGLDWVRFVASHEERHAAQILEMAGV